MAVFSQKNGTARQIQRLSKRKFALIALSAAEVIRDQHLSPSIQARMEVLDQAR
jgi:hypothetical protein